MNGLYLKDCLIVDGSGSPPYHNGMLVSGGRIAQITNQPPVGFSGETIDCKGALVTPGFIDCHSHNDWFVLSDEQHRYFDPFIQQGITTYITGNCGFSVPGYDCDTAYQEQIGGGLFHLDENSARTTHIKQWFDAVDQHCQANIALLVGHGTARIGVNGNKNKPLSPENKARMLANIEDALQNGACGVSLGLMYEPGIYAPTDELVDIARLCVKYDKILTVHPRAESAISLSYKKMSRSHLLQALDELDGIVRKTGVRLQYSHLIFVGRRSWRDVDEAAAILRKMKDDGFDTGFDMYPLDYGASIITVVLPDWYQAMTPQQKKRKLTKLKLAAMIRITTLLLGFDFSDISVAYAGENQREFIGKTVTEVAALTGVRPLDAYLAVCEKSEYKAKVLMGSYQNDAIVRQLMANEQSLFMTDAWVEKNGKQNGAIYGAFPRFIRIAQDLGWPIEKTIAKMTGLTAKRFKLENRGFIRENHWADLNIIDLNQLKDRIGEELPPVGFRYIFVNGRLIVKDGEFIEPRENPGRAVRVD